MRNFYYLKDMDCRNGYATDPARYEGSQLQIKPGFYKCYVIQEGDPDEQCVTVASFILHEDLQEDPETVCRMVLDCKPDVNAGEWWQYFGDPSFDESHGGHPFLGESVTGTFELYGHENEDLEIDALLLKSIDEQ
jgi:hypothetical protein